MEKAYGKEIQRLKDLLDEATAEPELYDRDYVDSKNIDTDGLWKPVIDRAGDGHRRIVIPEGHWWHSVPKTIKVWTGMIWQR